MNKYKQVIEDNAIKVPHLSMELAEYLKDSFSIDKQMKEGLLRDTGVRTESYMLGFIAGLAHSQNVIDCMLTNQEGAYDDLVDLTDNYLKD